MRRRRQVDPTDDSFATTCEARFTQTDGATNTYVLVWACPAGGEPPSHSAQEEICQFLFERRLVESCYAPTTAIFTEDGTPLPPARYTSTTYITFINIIKQLSYFSPKLHTGTTSTSTKEYPQGLFKQITASSSCGTQSNYYRTHECTYEGLYEF